MSDTSFELGKHMAKLSIEDGQTAVVILRPRYELKPDKAKQLIQGIDNWRRQTKANVNVLLVPHYLDVFVTVAKCQELIDTEKSDGLEPKEDPLLDGSMID